MRRVDSVSSRTSNSKTNRSLFFRSKFNLHVMGIYLTLKRYGHLTTVIETQTLKPRVMSNSSAHYHNSTVTGLSTRSAFLRHFNTNTLAVALLIALALLTTIRAKEPAMEVSPHAGEGEVGLAIPPCNTWVPPRPGVQVTNLPSAQSFGNKNAPHR